MKKLSLICLATAALLGLAGMACAASSTGSTQQRAAPVTLDELQHGHWIADGRDDAPRKVYVFLDTNCVYCAKFWADARPWIDSGKVQLRYFMVAVIAPASAGKAAALLADPDPAKRLAAYERAHAFGVSRMLQGGPRHSLDDATLTPIDPLPDAARRTLVANETLMNGLALRGTPGIVFQGPDGRLVARSGMPGDGLESILGPR